MSTIQVVVGGQYGSEAKGACTAFLARKAATNGTTVVVRVAGPNAGHTAYDGQGRRWALRQVPVAAVVDPDIELVIAAGSEIDFPVLLDEVNRLEDAGIAVRDRLVVDTQATMVTDDHKTREGEEFAGLVQRIGSTGKGIGAARADRLMRHASLAGNRIGEFSRVGIELERDTWHLFQHWAADASSTVIIEGTQGYALGLHAGYYPQCTSSDCRAIDFLSMAGIDPFWFDSYEPWVVFRTYPIRVAGNSGPLKGETTWEDLGFPEERTTVTNKVRRVGTWDGELARLAVNANGGPARVRVSLSMADYIVPNLKGVTTEELMANPDPYHGDVADLMDLVKKVEADTGGARVKLVGTGPQSFIEVH